MSSAKVSCLVTSRKRAERAFNLDLFAAPSSSAGEKRPVLSLVSASPVKVEKSGLAVYDFHRAKGGSLAVGSAVSGHHQLRPSVYSVINQFLRASAGPALAVAALFVIALRIQQSFTNPPEAFASADEKTLIAELAPEEATAAELSIVSSPMDAAPQAAMQGSNQVNFIAGMIAVNQPTLIDTGLVAKEIVETSSEEAFDPFFVAAVISVESRFATHARSRVGAMGLMQLRPSTAKEVSTATTGSKSYPLLTHPETNIRLGINYLKQMEKRYKGSRYLALAAYNWGPANVDRALKQHTRLPGSVHQYASKIIERSKLWARQFKSIEQHTDA